MRLILTALVLAPTLASCALPLPAGVEMDKTSFPLRDAGRLLARFPHSAQAPEGIDQVYARAGYLHPVFTPSGAVVTGDYCASHRHQHGVFAAWTRTRFEGREVDFWNAAEGEGAVRLVHVASKKERTSLEAQLAHVDFTSRHGQRVALKESWTVDGHAFADATVIDIESLQWAPDSPVEVLEHSYGGFAVRAPEAWEGADGARALTSEGLDRATGNATAARWVALSGPVPGGGEATIAVLAHPGNPRAPESVRIHPTNPYFCFAACQRGAFTIGTTPRRTRYCVVAMDGPPNAARLEELWRDFAAR